MFRRPLLLGTLLLVLLPTDALMQQTPQSVTRAQAVTSLLLTRTPELPPFDITRPFADLPETKWYTPYMRAGEQYGIVQTDEQGRLRPESLVTRAEYLKMLTLTFGLPTNQPHLYADVPAGSWIGTYAGIAAQYHMFADDADANRLQPDKFLTQKEASYALEQILRSMGKLVTREEEAAKREEQRLAEEQSKGRLQLYSVISTRRVRARFVSEPSPPPEPIAPPLPSTEQQAPQRVGELRSEMMLRINTIRTLNGLKPLKYNVLLERSAQTYAEDMAKRNFFSHTSPEGEDLKGRIQRGGYRDRSFSEDCFCVKGYSLAENLARGQRTAEEAVDAWMKSPAHRAAILSPEYKDIGFGIAAGYWVQHFGAIVIPSSVLAGGR